MESDRTISTEQLIASLKPFAEIGAWHGGAGAWALPPDPKERRQAVHLDYGSGLVGAARMPHPVGAGCIEPTAYGVVMSECDNRLTVEPWL